LGKIISFDDKASSSREKKAKFDRKRKIMAVRQAFQCASCALKCEKCGIQLDPVETADDGQNRHIRVPYSFCRACTEEYIDYIEKLKGQGDEACYWHNDAWIDAWRKWIDYQGSLDTYLKSKEFQRLLREIKESGQGE
jgi:Pyruvate/2-oxoacid:ferredoxin oxidoreductase delta subunit